jgi:hypothetical protein
MSLNFNSYILSYLPNVTDLDPQVECGETKKNWQWEDGSPTFPFSKSINLGVKTPVVKVWCIYAEFS